MLEFVGVAEAFFDYLFEGDAGVSGKGDPFSQHFRFGKVKPLDDPNLFVVFFVTFLPEMDRVVPIHDRKVGLESDLGGINPKEPMAHRMEGPSPQTAEIPTKEGVDSVHHLPSRLVGKGEEEDLLRRDPLIEEIDDAVCERAGLAGPGTGQD